MGILGIIVIVFSILLGLAFLGIILKVLFWLFGGLIKLALSGVVWIFLIVIIIAVIFGI